MPNNIKFLVVPAYEEFFDKIRLWINETSSDKSDAKSVITNISYEIVNNTLIDLYYDHNWFFDRRANFSMHISAHQLVRHRQRSSDRPRTNWLCNLAMRTVALQVLKMRNESFFRRNEFQLAGTRSLFVIFML